MNIVISDFFTFKYGKSLLSYADAKQWNMPNIDIKQVRRMCDVNISGFVC